MSSTRQVQEPKDRFNELLETSLADSPQMTRPDLKELLLAPETRTDTLTPPRRDLLRRATPRPH